MSEESCAICLNPIRRTRQTRTLECGHCYHAACFEEWEESGGDTCPLCREELYKPEFRVTISIENVADKRQSQRNLDPDEVVRVFDNLGLNSRQLATFSTELQIDVEDVENLETLFDDLGVSLADFNPSVLHAE